MTRVCPVCGGTVWDGLLRTDRARSLITDQSIAPRPLDKAICTCCGTVTNVALGGDETLAGYADAYRLNTGRGEEHIYFTPAGPVPRSQAFLNWLRRHLPRVPESVLEIGCGKGSLMARMADTWPGVPLRGIEGSRDAAALARSRGLDVTQGFVGPEVPDAADLVLAVGVLEHVEDPSTFLRALGQAVLPGGYAVLVIPVQDGGGYDLWFGDHVWHLFGTQFQTILERHGFEVLALDLDDPVVAGFGLALCRPAQDAIAPPSFDGLAARQGAHRDLWADRFADVDRRLGLVGDGPAIVFGSGEVLSLLLAYTALGDRAILACLDEDPGKIGGTVHGIPVHPPDWLNGAPPAPVLLAVNPRYTEAVRKKLERFARPLVTLLET